MNRLKDYEDDQLRSGINNPPSDSKLYVPIVLLNQWNMELIFDP
mgnify:CR=1 FL=1